MKHDDSEIKAGKYVVSSCFIHTSTEYYGELHCLVKLHKKVSAFPETVTHQLTREQVIMFKHA